MTENSEHQTSPDDEEAKEDWTATIVRRFFKVVETARSTTTQPAITASRGVVYGLVFLICLTAVLALTAVGLFRLVNLILPGDSWSAYLVTGALSCLLGGVLWSRRFTDRSTK